MIDVKAAVEQAVGYLRTLYPNVAVNDIQLEEIEKSDDGKTWKVTLSILFHMFDTKYKEFTIDAHTGEVRSMKIRVLQ